MDSLLLLFILILCGALGILFFIYIGNRLFFSTRGKSPYGGKTLRKIEEIHYDHLFLLERYIQEHSLSLSLEKAVACEKTGRVFPKNTRIFYTLSVGRNYLSKVYPGKWVYWGHLSDIEKKRIRTHHPSLEGFQLSGSSRRKPSKEDLLKKPGPLYVDLQTHNLLGWKAVPFTELELLVQQKAVH